MIIPRAPDRFPAAYVCRQKYQMKIQDLFDVTGNVAVVTGGASGIGYAYAEVIADDGAIVTIMDIDSATLEQAAKKLKARGGQVFSEIADVTDKSSIERSFDVVAKRHGRIDVVFANAGVAGGPGFVSSDAALSSLARSWRASRSPFSRRPRSPFPRRYSQRSRPFGQTAG